MKSKPAEQKTKAMELILKRTRSVLEEYQFRLKQCVAEKDTLLLQKEVLKQQLATLKRKGK